MEPAQAGGFKQKLDVLGIRAQVALHVPASNKGRIGTVADAHCQGLVHRSVFSFLIQDGRCKDPSGKQAGPNLLARELVGVSASVLYVQHRGELVAFGRVKAARRKGQELHKVRVDRT